MSATSPRDSMDALVPRRFLLVFAVAFLFQPCLGDEPASPPRPIREMTAALREQWSGRAGEDICVLQCEQNWHNQLSRRPSVILIPGMMANPDSMSLVRRELERAGFPVAVFKYSSQLSIEDAGAALRTELAKVRMLAPHRELALVTHSMGGLIARAAIELDHAGPQNVRRLIMIAPPNHGSALAELSANDIASSLDLNCDGDETIGMLDEAVAGFLGAAQTDLRPGSPFLVKLNCQRRANDLRYSILAGTDAPLEREVVATSLALASLLLGDLPESRPLLRSAQRFGSLDEWTRGRGDGVVSVQSTKLDGASELILLPFMHTDFGTIDRDDAQRRGAQEAVRWIVDSLRA